MITMVITVIQDSGDWNETNEPTYPPITMVITVIRPNFLARFSYGDYDGNHSKGRYRETVLR